MPSHPPVYILLLNYRGTDDTLACLDSLQRLEYPHYRIIVVDNASPDDSVIRLKARLSAMPGSFHLIESPQNGGFSAGNNLGIQAALAEVGEGQPGFVWLLNNDTTVAPDALTTLVEEAQTTGGIAGSLLLYPDGRYQQAGTRFQWWTGSTRGYAESVVSDGMRVETLSGASMLIPLEAFRVAGLLDESYFLYFEDGEASLRFARRGFPLTLCTRSRVYHKEGATTGRKSLMTQYYFHRNRLWVLFQFASPLQKISIGWYTAFRLLRSVVKSALSRNPERTISTRVEWLAVSDFWKGISGPCPHNLNPLRP
ncbi:glycosyltransferase family 2 protein [Vampirovibrio chlorellavorus]|uniref:glycosyltransferase family 2 protein n=1 Tax=Vampirovibrio chlorellavorus TaxID=758823 RepID=UPI0026ED21BF|nr:glycosyltransferase family 2 protein [Vampirovibrio chlorellavorus]